MGLLRSYFNLLRKHPYLKEISLNCQAPGSKPIFQGEYPGTVIGCNCLGVRYSYYENVRTRKLNQGACSYNETRAGCNGVPSTSSRKLNWSSSLLCGVFGEKNESFRGMMKNMKENGSCKSGFKKCGNVDGISQGLCIPSKDPCPITEIKIGSSNPDPSLYEHEVIIPNANHNIYYTRGNIAQPLIDLNTTESHMCLSSRKIAVSNGRSVYQLYNKDKKDHCEKDTRFLEYDSQGELDMF